MAKGKSVAISFRVSPRFKTLLNAAAAKERRSLTNMLEKLLFDYCKQHGLEENKGCFEDSAVKIEEAVK